MSSPAGGPEDKTVAIAQKMYATFGPYDAGSHVKEAIDRWNTMFVLRVINANQDRTYYDLKFDARAHALWEDMSKQKQQEQLQPQ